MTDLRPIAKRALSLLDLTNLNDDCSEADVRELCAKARTPFGNTAAVCVWPSFVETAKKALAGSGVKVATVVNFPSGIEPISEVLAATKAVVEDGADEVDFVVPWPNLVEGHPENVPARVARIRSAAGSKPIKAILETGMLRDPELIETAGRLALDGGADFLKTSTGKVHTNATPEAAEVLLRLLKETGSPAGFKAAGGVRTTEDAAVYLELADQIMGPDWATPATFRFGASSVLDALLATLTDSAPVTSTQSY